MWKTVGMRISASVGRRRAGFRSDWPKPWATRTLVVRWENGLPVPQERVNTLAKALDTPPGLIVLPSVYAPPPPIAGLRRRTVSSLPIPFPAAFRDAGDGRLCGGSLQKVRLDEALDYGLQTAFPRDSPLELLPACHLLAANARLEFRSPLKLGFQHHLVVVRHTYRTASHLRRHCLVLRGY